jgi:hypothetical protein
MSTAPTPVAEKKPRTLQDVQVDYQNGCLKAGQMQYQIAVLSKDLEMLNSVIKDLNFEAAQLQQINAAAAKIAAAQTPVPAQTPAPAQTPEPAQADVPAQPSTNAQGNA